MRSRTQQDYATSEWQGRFPDLVTLLRARAETQGGDTAYVFLEDGEKEGPRIGFDTLDRRARSIAAHLQDLGVAGKPALLLYPPGLNYIEAFFACLYAGAIAVPAYPPSRHHVHRLHAVVHDACPALVMTTADLHEKLRFGSGNSWTQDQLAWIATDTLGTEDADAWVPYTPEPERLAFLQYTSGSTGNPRGVMVTHANLLANQELIKQSFQHTEESTVVGWLPLYHDMGLIGNILQPLYVGATAVLMPPLAFLEKPIRWLQAISTFRACTSGGPNFAYELCVRRVTAEQKRNLDLSGWTLAFNGSEPVRATTLERFATAFAECGFSRGSFFPCYGLAEATLFVTGPRRSRPVRVRRMDRHALEQHRVALATAESAVTLVGCGYPWMGHELRAVDPETGMPCSKGKVGEIWVAGPSVAQGYWNHPEESEYTFRATLSGERNGRFLRTGDLGFVDQGELFITGRSKDLIIIRGRNYYPQDFERVLDEQVDVLRPGCNAVFSVTVVEQESLIVVAEVQREHVKALRKKGPNAIFQQIRERLTDECEIAPAEIVLVPPGSIPKTSSGKIRRQACRQAYSDGTLRVLARSGIETVAEELLPRPFGEGGVRGPVEENLPLLGEALRLLAPAQKAPLIARWLASKAAQLLCVPETSIPLDQPLCSLGFDSLRAVEFKHAVEETLGAGLPLARFLSDATLTGLAEELGTYTLASESRVSTADDIKDGIFELSYPQQAIFTVHRLDPGSIAYNLHLALGIKGHLDQEALKQSVARLVEDHPVLRTVYRADGTSMSATTSPAATECFLVVEAADWSERQLQEDFTRRTHVPFDLEHGPVVRLTLYVHGNGRYTLLCCAHHIALDLWSLLILIEQLQRIYVSASSGSRFEPTTAAARYWDFVHSQRVYVGSEGAETAFAYWRTQLSGELPLLALPTDYSKANSSSNEGASHTLRIGKELTAKLKALAQGHGATLFMTLLAAYKVLLYRYTHQTDIIVGAPSSGRTDKRYVQVVGNFVNPVAVRTYPSPELPFTAYLQHVREAVLGALAHEQFPFSLLVERLQPQRHGEEWPIYQTMFVLQQAQSAIDPNLSQLALGEEGSAFSIGEWHIHPIAIHERVENFDLKLMAAECEQGLIFSFQYRRELFRQETIAQMAAHFDVLLRGIIAKPNERLADLPLLTVPERYRLLVEWNATQTDYPKDKCIHQLFEAQVERSPQAAAVVYEDQSLSYRELNEKANQLAHHLRALGVGPDTLVGICVERSLEMIVGLLGILKAGGAYVPLDPTYPKERLGYMLEDARPAVLLTQVRLQNSLPEHPMLLCLDSDRVSIGRRSKKNLANLASPLNLAYVIYTSGSTGRPKGVGIAHDSLTNFLTSITRKLSLCSDDIVLAATSSSFDIAVLELLGPVIVGGQTLVASQEEAQDPTRLGARIGQSMATVMQATPSAWRWLLMSGWRADGSLRILCGGEPLFADLATQLLYGVTDFWNLYGPTETTVWSTTKGIASAQDALLIGRPIANTEIYLLDEFLEPVPIGVSGELYIAGAGLARGYLNRPELTAERFIPSPFSAEPGERLYRTGDLARYRPDGNIEYLGRIDHQVKVRGFRIELGEIEARLLEHPQVKEAVVIALDDTPGEKRLVAYVVGSGEWPENETIEQLRTHLGEILPDYMVPAAFVFLDSLPLTRTGKLDRNALPAPDVTAQLACQYLAPRTQVEAALTRIWADVLHVDRVGIHDSFFSLGGDSVRGIQMVSRANQAGLKLTPRQVFQHPTIAALAQVVEPAEHITDASICEQQTPLNLAMQLTPERFPLASLRQHELDALPLKPRDIEDIYPLAPMQEGMLFHTLAQPGTGVYVMQDRYEIRGTIDVNAFRQAWQRLIDHHPILRTSFLWDTETRAHQVVHHQVLLPFEFQDWCGLTETEQNVRLEDLLQAEQRNGFDLSVAPLIRIRLLQLGGQRYLCVRSFHHIVMDDWCTSPLFMEFKENYLALSQGMLAPRREVRPFRDYISWLTQQDPSDAERFWRSYLDGYTEPTPLVVERSSVRRQETNRAVSDIVTELSVPDTELLNALARRHWLTVNTFVQGALALLLGHYGGRTEVVFGVTVAGRPTTLPGVESMIGLFINGLPLKVRIRPEQPVIEWLRDVLTQNLEQRQYEYVPLVRIQSWSEIPRAQAVLFQHLLTFENAPLDPSLRARSDALDMEWVGNRVHTNYPMTFVAIPGSRLLLRLTYERERFNGSVMERMVDHFRFLLEGLVHHIDGRVGEIALLGAAERRQLCNDWNATVHAYAEPCDIIGRFEAQVEKTPETIAVVCGDARLTYGELNARANRVAHGLTALGVGPDVLVALLDDRGIDFLVMMLGIFKAGGAYVPLDPAHPDGRMVQVLEESRVRFMLCGERYRARAEGLIETAAVSSLTLVSLAELERHEGVFPNPPRRYTEQNLAFVIYTSGSTGKPKGAMVEHRGMFNNLITKVPALGVTSTDVIAQTASQCFDISVWQYLTALVIGARVEVFPDEISRDPARLLEQLAARGVTILETVPSMIRALLEIAEAGTELPALRWLMPCGEAFPPELCRQWMQRFPDLNLLNAYGPAECSDDVSYHPIELPGEGDLTVPIGRPVHNTRLYLLNRWLEPVPIGVPGEICVGGVQVGRGYLNRADLTGAAFIPDPFGEDGGRLYRSGDLGRYRSDGVLEFLGRIDHQVKIRGHRIEPGEIEACLVTHPEVREACVVPREVSEGVYRLVGYVVGAVREVGELRVHILKTLPEYMVPAAFVFLEALPLTPNGKVDRKRLPDPDIEAQLAYQYVAPRNPTEETLANIWAEVLRVERVGVHDNFFELGGDSILSIQIVSRARRAGLMLSPRDLFQHQQIAELAKIAGSASVTVAEQDQIQGDIPLVPIQHWFFEQNFSDRNHWNQVISLEVNSALDLRALRIAVREMVAHHDALRMRFTRQEGEWRQTNLEDETHEIFHCEDLSTLSSRDQPVAIARASDQWQRSLDIASGPLLRVVWFDLGTTRRPQLLIVIHHLVIDGVSWRILIDDLHTAYGQACAGERVVLPSKTTSFQYWSRRLRDAAHSTLPEEYWTALTAGNTRLPVEHPNGLNTEAHTGKVSVVLTPEETRKLLQAVPPVYRTQITDVLLAALTPVIGRWNRSDSILINLEGHGREDLFEDVDLSRTVGWFTTLFPVRLQAQAKYKSGDVLKSIKEQLRAVPRNGIGYGIRRYLSSDGQPDPSPQIMFNYLGQLDQSLPQDSLFAPVAGSLGSDGVGPDNARMHEWEIIAEVLDERLRITWCYSSQRYDRQTVEGLCGEFAEGVRHLIAHCLSASGGGCTPSDFPLTLLDQSELDDIVQDARNIEDIYPLSAMQEGLLLHTLLSPHSGVYLMQDVIDIQGGLDVRAFQAAWQQVVDTHAVLRTSFFWDTDKKPHQIVYKTVELPFDILDWREYPEPERRDRLRTLLQSELDSGLPLNQAPILRMRLIRMTDDRWTYVRSHHHILLDAWCLPLLLVDFLTYYEGQIAGQPLACRSTTPFRKYIEWLQHQDLPAAEAYWHGYLAGFSNPTYMVANRQPISLSSGEPVVADEFARLSREDTDLLNEAARRYRLTPNTFLQAAWAVLVSRYTNRQEVLFGVTVAGRPAEVDAVEEMVG